MVIKGSQDDLLRESNPLKEWIEDCLQQGEGAYIGYSTSLGPKELKEAPGLGVFYILFICYGVNRGI